MGTDKNVLRLVHVPGHGTRVLPVELVPVPWNGAQISARAPKKRLCMLVNAEVEVINSILAASKYQIRLLSHFVPTVWSVTHKPLISRSWKLNH